MTGNIRVDPSMRPQSLLADLDHALGAVGALVARISESQWSAPTPCTDWDVRRLVDHIVGMNLVFSAMLTDHPLPERGSDTLGEDPPRSYRTSSNALLRDFAQPGVLDRVYRSPMGSATGVQRLQIRLYDLLTHGWDLSQAIGRHLEVRNNVALSSLEFARGQVSEAARPGRFDREQPVAENAPALDRLAAFLGRRVEAR